MKIFEPEKFEIELVDELNYILNDKTYTNGIVPVSEMNITGRRLLNGAIRQLKPKKILEIGVAAGGSSAIILNAIKDINDAKLYSIDYNEFYYRDNSRKTGFLIKEKFNDISDKWKLYTGGIAAKFIDDIGDGIDFCLLDAAHINPGEILDFITIIPYLKKNAVVFIDDIILHYEHPQCITCGVLFSSLKGIKITPPMSNDGLVILDDDIEERIYDFFHLLTLPWLYLPSNEDILIMEKFIRKHYGENYAQMFLNIALHYKDKLFINSNLDNRINNLDNRINNLDNRINNIINHLAWWIPNSKKREEFRKKMNNIQ